MNGLLSESIMQMLAQQQANIDAREPYVAGKTKKKGNGSVAPEETAYRGRTWTDPLALNRNPTMGALLNPFGESFKAKSPAPMFDPIGYSAGWYKPGTPQGQVMTKLNDPFKLFAGKLFG